MRTPKTIRGNVFPKDGDWTGAEHWVANSSLMCSEQVREAAQTALLGVFSTDWCRGRPHTEHDCHPFEWWWAYGGGFRRILELGMALHILGSPEELTSDLTNARDALKFHTRSAEAWAGALMRRLGGHVEFIAAHENARTPDAIARWQDGTAVAIEVKSLQYSDFRRGITRVEIQFTRGLHVAMMERGGPPVPSWPDFDLPTDELVAAARDMRDDTGPAYERAKEWAFELGLELGNEWLDLLDPELAPGTVVSSDRVVAEIRERDGNAAAYMLPSIAEPESVMWSTLSRQLKSAAGQIGGTGLPGVLVVDSPWMGWPQGLLERLVTAANTDSSWVAQFGAVLLRVSADTGQPGAWLVPVARLWAQLPAEIRAVPLVSRVGLQFMPFDILEEQPG